MKVLYVLHSTIMGGATISFINMVVGLRDKGYSMVVVFPDNNESFIAKLDALGISHYHCPIVMSVFSPDYSKKSVYKRARCWLRLLKEKWKSWKQLSLIIKKEKPDIVHTNVGVVHEGFFCSRRYRIPHVWHLREYQDKDFGWRVFPSKSFFVNELKSSYVVSITKDVLFSFGLQESPKHRVIYNGVFSKEDATIEMPKKKFFLCASRISEEKGHMDVVKTFSTFHRYHPEYRLVVLGFGNNSFINSLKELCKQLGCDDSVVFEGYRNDVKPYMKLASALIVASRSEGFGRMTAEAAFCGCLVIGRNTGGTREILESIGGLAFDSNEGLLSNMNKVAVMTDEEYEKRVSLSQTKALAIYSTEKSVQDMDKFYHTIVVDA